MAKSQMDTYAPIYNLLSARVVKKEMPRCSVITADLYDVIDNIEKTIKDVCAFMETSLSDKMLGIDLSRSHRDRWKKEFSENELKKR